MTIPHGSHKTSHPASFEVESLSISPPSKPLYKLEHPINTISHRTTMTSSVGESSWWGPISATSIDTSTSSNVWIGSSNDSRHPETLPETKKAPNDSDAILFRMIEGNLTFKPGEPERNAAGAYGLLDIAMCLLEEAYGKNPRGHKNYHEYEALSKLVGGSRGTRDAYIEARDALYQPAEPQVMTSDELDDDVEATSDSPPSVNNSSDVSSVTENGNLSSRDNTIQTASSDADPQEVPCWSKTFGTEISEKHNSDLSIGFFDNQKSQSIGIIFMGNEAMPFHGYGTTTAFLEHFREFQKRSSGMTFQRVVYLSNLDERALKSFYFKGDSFPIDDEPVKSALEYQRGTGYIDVMVFMQMLKNVRDHFASNGWDFRKQYGHSNSW